MFNNNSAKLFKQATSIFDKALDSLERAVEANHNEQQYKQEHIESLKDKVQQATEELGVLEDVNQKILNLKHRLEGLING